MIAGVGVEDRTSLLQGFAVYLQGRAGDKMVVFYGRSVGEANDQARTIHSIISDWMNNSAAVVGKSPVRLNLAGGESGSA